MNMIKSFLFTLTILVTLLPWGSLYAQMTVNSSSGAELMRVTEGGYVGIGTTHPQGLLHIQNENTVLVLMEHPNESDQLAYPTLSIVDYQDSFPGHPYLSFRNAAGSKSAPSNLLAHRTLGAIGFSGWGDTGFQNVARIMVRSDDNFADHYGPAKMRFDLNPLAEGWDVTDHNRFAKMVIQSDGKVGINNYDPEYTLDVTGQMRSKWHIVGGSLSSQIKFVEEDQSEVTGKYWRWCLDGKTLRCDYDSDLEFTTGHFSTVFAMTSTNRVGINNLYPAYTLDVNGSLNVNGKIFQRGGTLHADYVFESDFVVPSIDEHSRFMWDKKHLPAVPKAQTDDNGLEVVDMGSHQRGMLEELETAHIYIEQLYKQNKILQKRLDRLETLLNQ